MRQEDMVQTGQRQRQWQAVGWTGHSAWICVKTTTV